MRVDFYILQSNEAGTTREQTIFSEDYAEIMVNKQIEYSGIKYQVKDLQWMNDNVTLKAVCLEIKLEK